jgi:predicted N-acetyltransferase YhbS
MIIRKEQPTDYTEVYELVKAAFAAAPHSDGTEADYLNDVRKKDVFIPDLSLLAENDQGKIIGQIVLYETKIIMADKELTELVLSPISVHPDYFRRGIAQAMMKRAFEIAKEKGYTAVFLCGEPEFYRKTGFVPTYEKGIFHITDKDKNAEWCMVRELVTGALTGVNGTIDIL